VEAIDLAPTLARVCGVSPPSSSTGRVLAEALAE
jgi:arylsulfatase A-like enzyme